MKRVCYTYPESNKKKNIQSPDGGIGLWARSWCEQLVEAESVNRHASSKEISIARETDFYVFTRNSQNPGTCSRSSSGRSKPRYSSIHGCSNDQCGSMWQNQEPCFDVNVNALALWWSCGKQSSLILFLYLLTLFSAAGKKGL